MKTPKKRAEVRPPEIIWNLGLLYKSPTDPQIEKDVLEIESLFDSFSKKYDVHKKAYLEDGDALLEALTAFERLNEHSFPKPLMYFYSLKDIESSNTNAAAQLALLANRFTEAENKITFFLVSLGKISLEKQKTFLSSKKLEHFKVFLERVFGDAVHNLSVAEEQIMNLKSLPAYDMWVMGNEKILNSKTIVWKKEIWPLAKALNIIQQLPKQKDRQALAAKVNEALKMVAPFSEAEINAVVTNKKINDHLRKFSKPYDNTVLGYRNDPESIEKLVKTVTDGFAISHRFYRLKSKLLKLKKLSYCDRGAKIGFVKSAFPFDLSIAALKETLNGIDSKFSAILQSYIDKGQIDAFPRMNKVGGAYCNHGYTSPVFLLLNHTDDLHSYLTLAHEFGHALHSEHSKQQGPIYSGYSTALAETASTLFEQIAMEAVSDKLSDKEKIIMLHDKINDDISTVFRQIACFNFEKDMHDAIRSKGFISHEELAGLHNRNMSAYLGPAFKLDRDDGYMFVQWSHIRRFFYVYSYAFGMLVSKAMLRRYRADKSFWSSIVKFLSAGGKDSPENILKEIGIDTSRPEFWQEGLREIEEDIERLERLTGKFR